MQKIFSSLVMLGCLGAVVGVSIADLKTEPLTIADDADQAVVEAPGFETVETADLDNETAAQSLSALSEDVLQAAARYEAGEAKCDECLQVACQALTKLDTTFVQYDNTDEWQEVRTQAVAFQGELPCCGQAPVMEAPIYNEQPLPMSQGCLPAPVDSCGCGGGIIDGGFVDGGFVDGGFVDGGIIDGGIVGPGSYGYGGGGLGGGGFGGGGGGFGGGFGGGGGFGAGGLIGLAGLGLGIAAIADDDDDGAAAPVSP